MIIDVNAAYGAWPFWDTGHSDAKNLANTLRHNDIERALVSPLNAPFSTELDKLNRQLCVECKSETGLYAVPVIHAGYPNWETSLNEVLSLGVPAIKIHPTHHLYSLRDHAVHELAEHLADLGIPLLIPLRIEDIRGQYRGLNIGDLPIDDVIAFHKRHEELTIVCLNASQPEILQIAKATNETVLFDFAYAESGATIDSLIKRVSHSRLLFGSQTPLLYTMAAHLKIRACTADHQIRQAICSGNAKRIFKFPITAS